MKTPVIDNSDTSPAKRTPGKSRLALIALVAFVLSVSLFYAEENWRGRRAWEVSKSELEAKGATLDWSKLIPPPVPDDQNFFKAPQMAAWFVRSEGQATNGFVARLANVKSDSTGTATNAITTESEARDYLTWSDQFGTDFYLIREALKRPYARMDGDYQNPSEGPTLDFRAVRSVARTLAQRAHCHLLIGEPEQAYQELTLLNDFSRPLRCAPTGKPMTLMAAMINVAISGFYSETVADGLRRHAWREPQLAALQSQLVEMNLSPMVLEAFRTQQSCVSGYRPSSLMYDVTNFWQKLQSKKFWLFEVAPHGWMYQNMAVSAQVYQEMCGSIEGPDYIFHPRRIDAAMNDAVRTMERPSPFVLLSRMDTPNFIRAMQVCARNQTMANEAQIACALERYRLARGEYPETLAQLMPPFINQIPQDIIGGKPLHYRRTDDGKFLLYSVGWNETDEGGRISTTLNKWGQVELDKGDWVWGN